MKADNPPESPDLTEPLPQRQASFEAAYQRQQQSVWPYRGVQIRTQGELHWIMQQRQWSGAPDLPEGWQRANLSGALCKNINLSGAQLCGAHIYRAHFHNANLAEISLADANLVAARLVQANLRMADLSRAQLKFANLNDADLNAANLLQADLTYANLRGANLRDAHLEGANLYRAVLGNVNLHGAHLTGANLQQAVLFAADLSDANLDGANLANARLDKANVTNTRFDNAILKWTQFTGFHGIPIWPAPSDEDLLILQTVQDEVIAPTTPSTRLAELAWKWPSLLLQDAIAANPNTPVTTLNEIAHRVPVALLRNPVLPLLFLENPAWLSQNQARSILQALEDQSVSLNETELKTMRLIEQCARTRSSP